MTGDPERPGWQLLGVLLPEHRVGWPGPAREQALAAAKVDAANAHVHLLDATYAALVAGEARAAARLLADCGASAPPDETWQRRIAACRSWIWTLDRLWYPGDAGAEIASQEGQPPNVPLRRTGDEETLQLEMTAHVQFELLNIRWQVETDVRRSPEEALAKVNARADRIGVDRMTPFDRVVQADLLYGAGDRDQANAVMADARRQLEDLVPNDAYAPAILARSFLLEGDRYATPGSSAEALGLDLWTFDGRSPFASCRDIPRAAAAYDQAQEWLAGVDAPRMRGALAVRRAALDWLSGDHRAQKAWLRVAADEYAAAGDAAGRWLTVVHDLLADVALGRIAATRRSAGTSFDSDARGPIAALRRWGEHDGSASWTSGLGRIFQRAAADWGKQGDHPRAELAYEMAAPLVPASGAETAAAVLLELATLDRRYGLGVRALTRSRAAVATLPPVSDAVRDPFQWARNLTALNEVLSGQLDGEGTAAGIQVAALDWAIERTQELLALPGAPGTAGGRVDTGKRWAARVRRTRSPMQLAMLHQLAALAEIHREFVSYAQASASFERGREAAAAGAIGTAERWYDDASAHLAEWPRFALMEVVFIAARDRFEEARARLRELADAPGQSDDLYAIAALRAHDFTTALRLFGSQPELSRPWPDLVDHAEAALGAGEVELAVTLIEHAVRTFEERLGRLRRDVDRVASCDDTRIARLYLLAARAQLAFESGLDEAPERRAWAFELSDRARTLALDALIADASDETDDEQLILAWRRATSEWQAAHDRLGRAYMAVEGKEEIDGGTAALAAAEHRLVEVEAELEDSPARARPPTARPATYALRDVQEALPRGAALVEYQLAGRDLLVWTVTRTTASAHTSSHATGSLARLAKAVQRACANGDPGQEAGELAEICSGPWPRSPTRATG